MNMNKNLCEYTNKCQGQIRQLCQPLLEFLEITHFSYSVVNNSGDYYSLNNYPKLMEFYFDNEFYINDPHIVTPNNINTGVALWSACDNVEYQGGWIHEAREIFNIDFGISIVKKLKDSYQVFSFGTTKTNFEIYNTYFNHIALLQEFTDFFTENAAKLLTDLSTHSFNMSKIKGENYFNQCGITKLDNERPYVNVYAENELELVH